MFPAYSRPDASGPYARIPGRAPGRAPRRVGRRLRRRIGRSRRLCGPHRGRRGRPRPPRGRRVHRAHAARGLVGDPVAGGGHGHARRRDAGPRRRPGGLRRAAAQPPVHRDLGRLRGPARPARRLRHQLRRRPVGHVQHEMGPPAVRPDPPPDRRGQEARRRLVRLPSRLPDRLERPRPRLLGRRCPPGPVHGARPRPHAGAGRQPAPGRRTAEGGVDADLPLRTRRPFHVAAVRRGHARGVGHGVVAGRRARGDQPGRARAHGRHTVARPRMVALEAPAVLRRPAGTHGALPAVPGRPGHAPTGP